MEICLLTLGVSMCVCEYMVHTNTHSYTMITSLQPQNLLNT